MTLRLRQICLVSPSLEPAVTTLCEGLGLQVCYRDPNVAKYGLVNAIMPVGNTFLEVVAPTGADTAAGRYLVRRKGEGGYMVILECDDIAPWVAHLSAVGVRVAADLDYPGEYRGLQLHPRDTGGTLLEINWSHGAADGAYHPAGPHWLGALKDDSAPSIVGATIQASDPVALAKRWSLILRRPFLEGTDCLAINLESGALRFVPATDGRGEGLAAIEIRVATRGASPGGEAVSLCGMHVQLSE
jgi:hypothetical protein